MDGLKGEPVMNSNALFILCAYIQVVWFNRVRKESGEIQDLWVYRYVKMNYAYMRKANLFYNVIMMDFCFYL